jgi:DNA polymerase III epsilon subunit-like protein
VKTISIECKLIVELVRRLNRPLTIYDLEGTGFRCPTFGITEVGALTILPDGRAMLYGGLVNPEFPITAKARQVTGITDKMVANQETWGVRYARHFDKISREHIISGFNICTFDNPAVIDQNARYGITTPKFNAVVDVRRMYQKAANVKGQSGKLEEVAALYGVQRKGDAHRATSDVILTAELLEALLKQYGEAVFMELLEGTAARNRARGGDNEDLVSDVVAHLQVRGFTSMDVMAKSLGVEVKDLDFPVCRAIDNALVDAFQFAHAPTRTWLKSALPAFFANQGPFDGKMKPLLEALSVNQPASVQLSYIQLRIGLLDAGYVWGMLKPQPLAA